MPVVYNIEQVDQDITQVLGPDSPLTAECKGDLLGGVMVIKGVFAGGGQMTAIPNFVRNNRGPVLDPATLKPPPTEGVPPLVPQPPSSGLRRNNLPSFLTSSRGQEYPFLMKGGADSDLNRSESPAAQKQILIPIPKGEQEQ